jgi:UDP-GlcNAc:undecaprenyl-phosphate/decaprenyl-phosphate GlcNAc-1-phosphate transferase
MVSIETFFVCLICMALTGVLCLLAMRICTGLGLIDVPDVRKLHQQPTPLAGGLALALIVLPMSAVLAIFGTLPTMRASLLLFISATMAMVLLGLEDDRRSLTARNRLILSVVIFVSVAMFDPLFNIRQLRFTYPLFEIGMGIAPVGFAFTTICCVGLVNAVNMADGKNGLVIGLAIGWLAMLAMRAPPILLPQTLLLIASLTTLLIFNLKGRIFLGDGGVYGFACAIGLLTIAIYNSPGSIGRHALAAEEIMLLFGLPVLDSFRLTYSRLRRGQSPMAADRDHFHHHLQDKLGWPQGLIAYLLLALVPALLGFNGIIPPSICLGLMMLLYVAIILATRGQPALKNASDA